MLLFAGAAGTERATLVEHKGYTYLESRNLGSIDPFVPDNRARNYTRSGTRPHNLVVNYSYEVPNLSQKWNALLVKALADNWQISGITSILSGTKQGFSYGFTGVPTGTLSGTGAIHGIASRPDIVCDPNISRGDRSFDNQSDTFCIRPPSDANRLGNAKGDEYQGPGYMNWDFSFFKVVPRGGTRWLQFRVELYNAFNSDQWTLQTRARSQLRHGRADRREFRQADGRDPERPPHPAGGEVHVLTHE